MTQRESDERRKLTRRKFIKYSAAASGAALGAYGMTLKTDAIEDRSGFAPTADDHTLTYGYR